MKLLGCTDDVTEGILAGRWGGEEWVLEVNSSFIPHGFVSEEAGRHADKIQEESKGVPKFAQDAILDYAEDVNQAQEEFGGQDVPKFAISPTPPTATRPQSTTPATPTSFQPTRAFMPEGVGRRSPPRMTLSS